ncbi:2-hydroxyacid dehydrogenase [Neorhizobium tomejilense]
MTIGVYDQVQPAVRDLLHTLGNVVPMPGLEEQSAEVLQQLRLLVTSAMRGVDQADLDRLPALKTIISCGAGRDRYDFDILAARGIKLRDTAEVVISDAAEMGVALTLALARNLMAADRFVRSGDWSGRRFTPTPRLAGSRVGIVGLGRIGSLVAARLEALGCKIAYSARHPRPARIWEFQPDVVRLAEWSDFLVLTCPGGPETRHLVGSPVLSALGPRGYLVNISRGSVVDEEALIGTLSRGEIAGAALDVFENEPNPDRRFMTLANVLLTPHSAAVTERYVADLVQAVERLVVEESIAQIF